MVLWSEWVLLNAVLCPNSVACSVKLAKADSQKGLVAQAQPNKTVQQLLNDYEKKLKVVRQRQDKQAEILLLLEVGGQLTELQAYDRAIQYYLQGLAISREIKNRRDERVAMAFLELPVSRMGDEFALDFYQKQWAEIQTSRDLESQTIVLEALYLVYSKSFDLLQAVDVAKKMLAIAQQRGDREGTYQALNALTDVYNQMADYPLVLQTLQKQLALALALESGERGDKLDAAYAKLVQVYVDLEDFPKAIATHQEYQKYLEKIGQKSVLTRVFQLQDLAFLYAVTGNMQQPIQLLETAIQMLEKAQESPSFLLGDLARAYALVGNFNRAVLLQEQAIATSSGIADDEAQALLGFYSLRSGNAAKAVQILSSTLPRLQASLEQEKENFYYSTDIASLLQGIKIDDGFRNLQEALVATNQFDRALEVSEANRSRALADLLINRFRLNSGIVQAGSGLSINQIQQVARAHQATLVQYTVLYDDLRPVEYGYNQRPMQRGQAFPQAKELLIWVVKPQGPVTLRRVKLSSPKAQPLAELIQAGRSDIGVVSRGISFAETTAAAFPVNMPQTYPGLQKLYRLLIKPIQDLLPANAEVPVVFIPQDELFMVPFAALQNEQGEYLIQRHTIVTAPSIQVLDLTRQRRLQTLKATPSSNLVVGNPTMPKVRFSLKEPPQQLTSLPGSEQEAQAIAPLLKTQPLMGDLATKARVIQQMKTAQIIHLATHGLLDSFSSLRQNRSLNQFFNGYQGAIALAPTSQDEGLLKVTDILKLQLTAELVVLSACDTGRGSITGDGVIGLSRAFLAAGVPSLVISLWKVPDKPTATLMQSFYQNLQQQPDKAQALRQAMLATMKDYPNPQAWAAFTLVGQAQ